MKWYVARGLLAGIVSLTSVGLAFSQDGRTPRGYLFFSARSRQSPTTRALPQKPSAGVCCGQVDDSERPVSLLASSVSNESSPQTGLPKKDDGPSVTTPIATESSPPRVEQANWGAEFGLGYGYTNEAYSPGALDYAFGKPPRYPLHGYQSTYTWAGHRYCMHCYCSEGYPPFHCPGYRGECYVPCWNDAGTLLIERHCGRGSPFDCFWHMGGYERPCRTTDCPQVCSGMPAYFSYGFPKGTAGDPHYRPNRQAGTGTPPEKYDDPYPPIPNTKPLAIPEDIRNVPRDPPPKSLNGKPPEPAPELPTPKPPK